MKKLVLSLAALAVSVPGCAAPSKTSSDGLTVDRIVLLMRHGIRPPTKNPPMAPGTASDPWPAWDVAPGYLTSHGAKAVTLLGGFDRAVLAAGLFQPGNCPAPGAVSVYSDNDERTIATGDAWLAGFAPGCTLANEHKPQDVSDPLFSPTDTLDAGKANAAVADHLGAGGIAAAEAQQRDVLARLDRIYCGPSPASGCGFSDKPTRLTPARTGKKPSFEGALDLGSTAGQILVLEYADGKPMSDVGWGRASKPDIAAASALHAVEYDVLARPGYVAARYSAAIARRMLSALGDPVPGAAKVTLIVGHDGNVAALAGVLDLHWQTPGLAPDDPPPGGAIGFELLRDKAGNRFVRAIFRSQTLDQMRTLAPLLEGAPAHVEIFPIKACGAGHERACPLATFTALMERQLAG